MERKKFSERKENKRSKALSDNEKEVIETQIKNEQKKKKQKQNMKK